MTDVNEEKGTEAELPIDALALQAEKDRYKIGYAALRWAKEIKQKENLPEPVPLLIPRALREILTGKVAIADVEKLPMAIKITQPAPQAPTAAPASTPTITLNPPPDGDQKEAEAEAEPAKDAKADASEAKEEKPETKEEK